MKQRVRKRLLQRWMTYQVRQDVRVRQPELRDDSGWYVRENLIGSTSIAPFMPYEVVRRRSDGQLETMCGPSGRQLRFKTEARALDAIRRMSLLQ